MQELLPRFERPGQGLLVHAVIYFDDDLVKWILRNFLAEREHINDFVFYYRRWSHLTGYRCKHENLLSWVERKITRRGSESIAGLLAVETTLLYFDAKQQQSQEMGYTKSRVEGLIEITY